MSDLIPSLERSPRESVLNSFRKFAALRTHGGDEGFIENNGVLTFNDPEGQYGRYPLN